jgi:isopenicillin N synthase-like dioxygenase
MMEFLSGGFYKATIHKVIQPPPDQRQHTRLGLFYFALPDDDVKLSVMESPVLQREGVKRRFEEGCEPRVEEWRRARTSGYGQTALQQGKDAGDAGVEEEVIKGATVRHYK